jgi:hypothetical protein
VCLVRVTTAHQDTDQIVELFVGDAFDVEEDLHRLPDHAWRGLEVDLLGPDR